MKEERDGGEYGNERQKELSKSFVGSTRLLFINFIYTPDNVTKYVYVH